jgi:hypothetical protein
MRAVRHVHEWFHSPRTWNYFMLLIVTIIFTLILVAAVLLVRTPSPFHYSADVYRAERDRVCPGDTLRWQVEVNVNRPPYVARIVRGIYDVQHRMPVGFGRQDFVPMLAEGIHYERHIEFEVPADLPPGRYEIHNVASTEDSTHIGYRVRFQVLPPEECADVSTSSP